QAGWLFDAQLEAIVGAIERKILVESAGAESDADSGQLNYTRDCYVLPWDCAARAGERASGAAGGARPVDPRETPGLVVFRNRNQKRLLLLFLIGETPTFGIHEIALSRALTAAAEGCGPTTCTPWWGPSSACHGGPSASFAGTGCRRCRIPARCWDSISSSWPITSMS
ncbi:MAG: hypothetical protein ACREWE_07865, partial [Gammaproteobacteria bacterium]